VTAVGRRGRDTATVVITVDVGAINLAFEKHATQSSNYNIAGEIEKKEAKPPVLVIVIGVIVVPAVALTLLALIVMSGPTTTLKTFKENWNHFWSANCCL
jgi:hypothetical protein